MRTFEMPANQIDSEIILEHIKRILDVLQQRPNDQSAILDQILQTVIDLTGADDSGISFFNPTANETERYSTSHHFNTKAWPSHFQRDSLSGMVIQNGSTVVFSDTHQHENFRPELINEGVRSVVAVGILDSGALFAYSAAVNYFNEAHLRVLELLASLVLQVLNDR